MRFREINGLRKWAKENRGNRRSAAWYRRALREADKAASRKNNLTIKGVES